jgi:heterodisulfide reductase subunit A2
MASVRSHENVELRSYSEVVEVSGYVGNFKVKIRKKPRYVDVTKCTGCGICWTSCPATMVPEKRVIKKGDQIIKQIT